MNNIDFLHWIAKGVNPYTGELFSNDDLLRDRNVMVRLFELETELREFKKKPDKLKVKKYNLSSEIIEAIQIVEPETTIAPFAANIASATALGKNFVLKKIREFLVAYNYLEYMPASDNKPERRATELGERIGMFNKEITSQNGTTYSNVYYSVEAQKFLISKLAKILN